MRKYFVEKLNPDFGYFYTVNEVLFQKQTEFQDLKIIDTNEFGRVLLLDEITQVVEKNEFQYHEVMVHPALVSHSMPEDICIIGAGDGGILREVLKHNPKKATQCELDIEVIEACKKYLPNISKGAFDKKEASVHIGDGRKFIEENPNSFDAVIMDMTDPFGPSTMLYTKEFFDSIKKSFKSEDGVFTMHCESPISRPVAYQQILTTLEKTFKYQTIFYVYIQMYSVLWAIVVNSDSDSITKLSKEDIEKQLKERNINDLEIYNADSHFAMTCEYPYITKIRKDAKSVPVITDENSTFLDEIDLNTNDAPLKIMEIK